MCSTHVLVITMTKECCSYCYTKQVFLLFCSYFKDDGKTAACEDGHFAVDYRYEPSLPAPSLERHGDYGTKLGLNMYVVSKHTHEHTHARRFIVYLVYSTRLQIMVPKILKTSTTQLQIMVPKIIKTSTTQSCRSFLNFWNHNL